MALRVAILSMLETAGDAQALPRAFLRIGPASLARHQLSLALAMECQRIVCIARQLSPELVQLQHETERAGAKFHCINGPRALSGLVTATDELLVISDGLLPPLDAALTLLEGAHSVVVQPVESGVAAGFERIDLNHASAGLMRIPGRLVERLQELPADCDAASALTRIALQAGVEQRPLPGEAREAMRWKLVRNEGEAHAAEAGWIGAHLDGDGPKTPGTALARFAVRTFGPAILHAGSGGNALAIGAAVIIVLTLGLGWAGFAAIALALCGIGWIVRRAAALLMAVEQESMAHAPSRWPREPLFDWVNDLIMIAIMVWNTAPFPDSTIWQRGFAPLILLCLVRLFPRLTDRAWAAWLADRSLLALLLAIAAGAGVLTLAIPALAVLLGLLAILLPARLMRITRD
jgi:hypothetical protein